MRSVQPERMKSAEVNVAPSDMVRPWLAAAIRVHWLPSPRCRSARDQRVSPRATVTVTCGRSIAGLAVTVTGVLPSEFGSGVEARCCGVVRCEWPDDWPLTEEMAAESATRAPG